MDSCYCGNNKSYSECCEPYITLRKTITSCEVLMRARITAHIMKDIDFLYMTNAKSIRKDNTKSIIKNNVNNIIWRDIKIINVNEDKKTVTWEGTYRDKKDRIQVCMERHSFDNIDDKLYFTNSVRVRNVAPVTSTKYPRNSPCHCGSGLKYKRCCVNG